MGNCFPRWIWFITSTDLGATPNRVLLLPPSIGRSRQILGLPTNHTQGRGQCCRDASVGAAFHTCVGMSHRHGGDCVLRPKTMLMDKEVRGSTVLSSSSPSAKITPIISVRGEPEHFPGFQSHLPGQRTGWVGGWGLPSRPSMQNPKIRMCSGAWRWEREHLGRALQLLLSRGQIKSFFFKHLYWSIIALQ